MNQSQTIFFYWNQQHVELDFSRPEAPRPSTTVLNWLRSQHQGKGTKEGCAEGDCGACTVVAAWPDENSVMRYHAVNSCLIFLPWLHGKQLITVEGLADNGHLHPVQQAVVDFNGTQCGFCTPGIVMSLFAIYKNGASAGREDVVLAMSGNLCRCTGYEPILEAAMSITGLPGHDHLSDTEAEIAAKLKEMPEAPVRINHQEQLYMKPASLSEAISLRQAHPQAVVFCGGTDVALAQTKKFIEYHELIDLTGLKELTSFTEDESGWTIGAALPLEAIHRRHDGRIPMFDALFRVFASKQIRETATLGGNLGTASPIGDTWPVLMALEAIVVVSGPGGQRTIDIGNLITGYRRTAILPDEIILEIKIPKPKPERNFKFLKLSKRRQMDIATVSVAVSFTIDSKGIVHDPILAFGGMSDRPERATLAEQVLHGHLFDEERIDKACRTLNDNFRPISDARSS
ncbi:MAG: xanthine dehydrogenase small subunit, partial [Bacteroidetes bacterium HGW-Bacteroidetes-22]